MGIKKFYELKAVKESCSQVKLTSLCNTLGNGDGKKCTVAIDAMIKIYASLRIAKTLSFNGQPTSHINTTLQYVAKLKKAGLNQIWIFDSPVPPACKMEIILERKKATAKTNFKPMTAKFINDVKQVLDYCGVPYIVSPPGIEAENVGAYLVKSGACDALFTNDSDALGLYECPIIIRQNKTKFYKYVLADILENMKVSFAQLQVISIHMGTDYAPKSPRIGPKTILKKYEEMKLTDKQKNALKFVNAKFKIPKIHTSSVNKPAIRKWVVNELNFNPARVEKILKVL